MACEYAPLEPGDRLQPAAPLALDIDLDYFCVNYPPEKPPIAYPIEESFAREVIENPYHWSRVEGNGMKVERDGKGRWVLAVREPRLYRTRAKDERPPHQIIAEALERLGQYLDEFHLSPALITICRSEYSGYTPRALTYQIEAGVRALLQERFDLEEHSLNSLLPEPRRIPANTSESGHGERSAIGHRTAKRSGSPTIRTSGNRLRATPAQGARNSCVAIGASLDGKPAGLLIAAFYRTSSGPEGLSALSVLSLHVTEPCRRRGLGAALLSAAEEQARAAGCGLMSSLMADGSSEGGAAESLGHEGRLHAFSDDPHILQGGMGDDRHFALGYQGAKMA